MIVKIAKNTASIIKSTYQKVDVLLLGYVAASSWPHSYNLSESGKRRSSQEKNKICQTTNSKKVHRLYSLNILLQDVNNVVKISFEPI